MIITLTLFIPISLTEIKPPINHLSVVNEKCLQWRAEKYEEDTEFYKVTADVILLLSLQLLWMGLFLFHQHEEQVFSVIMCAQLIPTIPCNHCR